MSEYTRPLNPLVPLSHGGWSVDSFMSSPDFKIRGMGLMPPNSIVPVIVVPGIMGTNLRAKRKPRLGRVEDERNQILQPGRPAWRPPNGTGEGLLASVSWGSLSARERQRLFDAATLEIDDSGPVVLPKPDDEYVLTESDVRARGWGEVHAESYGHLLYALQSRLNQTFDFDDKTNTRTIRQHWKDVMACDQKKWSGVDLGTLTEGQLVKQAQQYFPVYASGYVWLSDCKTSSELLEQRILHIIDYWRKTKRRCEKVILVTHSMGGLVARACAKRIPDKIAGVIHGVMPALGAPVAYRRIASGTESLSPGSDLVESVRASRTAKVLGETAQKTTPVLATSAGALALLPNHMYPQPWLHVRVVMLVGGAQQANYGIKDGLVRYQMQPIDPLHFPNSRLQNPYDLYRDMTSWYRLINPALADPAAKYADRPGGVRKVIEAAISAAEKFHRTLGDYYHPNTFVFYGNDKTKLSFGQIRWVAHHPAGLAAALTPASLATAKYLGDNHRGQRRVLVEGKTELHFEPEPQDDSGDGTVPHVSGAVPGNRVKKVFATTGYDHQGSYANDDILKLTLRLIAKIVQEMS